MTSATEPQHYPAPPREGRRRGRVNDQTLWWLLLLLALMPLPLGASRPALWPICAAAVGLAVAIYSAQHWRRDVSLALPIEAYRLEAALWCLFCLLLAIQLVPIGALVPLGVVTADGALVALRQVSVAPGLTLLVVIQSLSYGLVFFMAAQISVRTSRARRFLVGVVVIVSAYAAYGLLALLQLGDTILGLPKWAYEGSATATFVNRNTFATFLSLGLVSAVALCFGAYDDARRRLQQPGRAVMSALPIAAAAMLLFVTLLATTSRAGLAAGVGGVAVVAILALARLAPGRPRLAIAVTGIAIVVVLTATYGQGVLERLGSAERDFDGRADLYRQTWELITLRPWLGYGGGAFEFAFPLVHQEPVSLDLVWDKAHSTFLTLWTELGLIGGSLPMLVIALIFIRLLTRSTSVTVSANGLAGIGAIVVSATHSSVDFSLEIPAVAYLFAAILGAAIGSGANPAHERASEND